MFVFVLNQNISNLLTTQKYVCNKRQQQMLVMFVNKYTSIIRKPYILNVIIK